MTNKLQQLFPMIQTRQEVLAEIHSKPALLTLFNSWAPDHQEEFLSFVTGATGVKILYDSFFKEVLNPETVPGRLNTLLSLLLGKKVKILSVLPTDNSRLADDSSLVIMDIVVKLEDGSIVDVEIQKIGYRFPGQRSACYSADLLLRQYKRIRGKTTSKKFSYKDIRPVYTIVFFESSPAEFHKFSEQYLHNFHQTSDTGLEMELLQKYLYIPLDIFHQNLQNKGITSDLDAWLAFLSTDDPEIIYTLINYSPVFKELYSHIYEICQNIEDVMQMFSEELRELDRNTVQLMIDEMQDEIIAKAAIIAEQNDTIAEHNNTIAKQGNTITEQNNTITEQSNTITEQQELIAKLTKQLEEAQKNNPK